MIIKSFELEKIKSQKNNFILLYGSNDGFKTEIINNYFIKDVKGELLRVDENEVIKDENFIDKLLTKSLFEEEKIIIISRVTDKIFSTISEIIEREIKGVKIILNSNILEKNSKLRKFFEKEKNLTIIPFYDDNVRNLSFITQQFFQEKKIKVSQEIINLLVERCQGDRGNLKNELNKIANLSFTNKNINLETVSKLSNLAENYSVFLLSDNFLAKNSRKVSHILNENNYSPEDCILIVRTILSKSKRLLWLKEDISKNNSIDTAISSYKPPIFWKEKEIVKKQVESWSFDEVKKIIYKINDLELLIKKNSNNSINLISDFVRSN